MNCNLKFRAVDAGLNAIECILIGIVVVATAVLPSVSVAQTSSTQLDPDVTNDGIVNVLDLSRVGACFGGDVEPKAISIVVQSPTRNVAINTPAIGVRGTVMDETSVVTVNGLTTTRSNDRFSIDSVPLAEGENLLQILASSSVPPPCFAEDLTGDGEVDFADLQRVVGAFGTTGYPLQPPQAPTHMEALELRVVLDTVPPVVTIASPSNGVELFSTATDVRGTVDDPEATLSFVNGGVSQTGVDWVIADAPLAVGDNSFTVIATDGAGNEGSATIIVKRAVPVVTRIQVAPPGGRIEVTGAQFPLTATAIYNNGDFLDVTSDPSTVWRSDNPFVADIDEFGVVTARDNGQTRATATYLGLSDDAQIEVEIGVALVGISLTPSESFLRGSGVSQQLQVLGQFSDGSERELTDSTLGTLYSAAGSKIVSVSEDGLVSALGDGVVTVTASNGGFSAVANVGVSIQGSDGFVRGQALDDATGLPMSGVAVRMLFDGAGALASNHETVTDQQGRWILPGLSGMARVHLTRPGYTDVFREGELPAGTASRLMDSRLTRLANASNPVVSALGASIEVPPISGLFDIAPGAMPVDSAFQLTTVGAQGLMARLPRGWSPIWGLDVRAQRVDGAGPLGGYRHLQFATPALLRTELPNGLPANAQVVLARYAFTRSNAVGSSPSASPSASWQFASLPLVASAGESIGIDVPSLGYYALLVADAAPSSPLAGNIGESLTAATQSSVPASLTAHGEVSPAVTAPSVGLRAQGRLQANAYAYLPSGAWLNGFVVEKFDRTDGETARPVRYRQDWLLHAWPLATVLQPTVPGSTPSGAGTSRLFAKIPVVPSREYSIRELSFGQVRLEVDVPPPLVRGVVVGENGSVVDDSNATSGVGFRLEVPAGALARSTIVDLLAPHVADEADPLDGDLVAIGEIIVDLAGASLRQTARLSIPTPASLPQDAQVLLFHRVRDATAVPQWRLVALATERAGRLVSQVDLGAERLSGVVREGRYVFAHATTPRTFVVGSVLSPTNSASSSSARTSPGVIVEIQGGGGDVADSQGRFAVAVPAQSTVTLNALDPASGDRVTANLVAGLSGDVTTFDLVLGTAAPDVVSVTPADAADNVATSTPVRVDFSEAIEPSSVDATSLRLETVDGMPVAALRNIVSDGTAVEISVNGGLQSATAYRIVVGSGVEDLSGNPLSSPSSTTFRTKDTSRSTFSVAGQIVAALPNGDGMVEITGTQGTAEPGSTVVIFNARTGESAAVIAFGTPNAVSGGSGQDAANFDGSFRLRIGAEIGDPISISFRGPNGRLHDFQIDHLIGPNGVVGIGAAGGQFSDEFGRLAQLLSGTLTTAGLFAFDSTTSPSSIPTLPAGWQLVDQFTLRVEAAQFAHLQSLRLRELRGNFETQSASQFPFSATADFFVPSDFLVNGLLRFEAVVQDANGNRERATGATLVRGANADPSRVGSVRTERFPSVVLTAPTESLPDRQLQVSAQARAARIDIEIDLPTGADRDDAFLLARVLSIDGAPLLEIVDRFDVLPAATGTRLRTNAANLPGATQAGRYVVLSFDQVGGDLVYPLGRVPGARGLVRLDGTPFVADSGTPNGQFVLPTIDLPLSLTIHDAQSGAILGTHSVGSPGTFGGALGDVLASNVRVLQVAGKPSSESLVEIDTTIELQFSEDIDARTISPSNIFLAADNGARVPTILTLQDTRTLHLRPLRRLVHGRSYRYGVASSVTALSGAMLALPFEAQFTTFAPTAPDVTRRESNTSSRKP